MPVFSEEVLLFALTARPEDARRFVTIFKPEWLKKAEYQPILSAIYAFTKKHKTSPSITALHEYLRDQNKELYELRYKEALETIAATMPDLAQQIYTLDKAADEAICRQVETLQGDQAFLQLQADRDGQGVIKYIYSAMGKFITQEGNKNVDLKQATDELVVSGGSIIDGNRITTGIAPIDEWTGGGLKRKQLGILMAPTGHGKTFALIFMGVHMGGPEDKKVWYVTNELPTDEITERALARLSGVPLSTIMEDAAHAFNEKLPYKLSKYEHNMRISEINAEISVDELEVEMQKWASVIGWKPDVLIIDYMERMKPSTTGFSRDQSWNWQGAIARDLVRFAKRNNILVWTACQTNRAGLGAEVLGLDMAQGSIQHLQEASAVVAMKKCSLGDKGSGLTFKSLKMRHSMGGGKPVTLKTDTSTMTITKEVYEPVNETDRAAIGEEQEEQTKNGYFAKKKRKSYN